MNRFRDFLEGHVRRIGWREFVRRSNGEFTEGALQGWFRGAFPGPTHQLVIAAITGARVEHIKDLVWESEKAREEARLAAPFRPRRGNGGAAAAETPRPRQRSHPPAVARPSVTAPSRRGGGGKRRLIGHWPAEWRQDQDLAA